MFLQKEVHEWDKATSIRKAERARADSPQLGQINLWAFAQTLQKLLTQSLVRPLSELASQVPVHKHGEEWLKSKHNLTSICFPHPICPVKIRLFCLSFFKKVITYYASKNVCICVCHCAHVEVREPLEEVGSLHPPCCFWFQHRVIKCGGCSFTPWANFLASTIS